MREKAKKHMGRLFVRVVANAAERAIVNEEDGEKEARRMKVDAARELGGSVEQLGKFFGRQQHHDDLSYFVGLESAVDHCLGVLSSSIRCRFTSRMWSFVHAA